MTAAVIIESYIENCNNFKVFVPKANQRASQNLKAHLYLNQCDTASKQVFSDKVITVFLCPKHNKWQGQDLKAHLKTCPTQRLSL